MSKTMIEKILINHSDKKDLKPGDIVDVKLDIRVARDFGGANVVKNIVNNNLSIENKAKTFFTFDCNPGGSDQAYAANQHKCRLYAREKEIGIFDINSGIGTHLVIDKGLVGPGSTFISTDSHANILGSIGAFGQGMGDRDIAYGFSFGKVWFKVPESVKIILKGKPSNNADAKDIVLAMLKKMGANGLLGYAAEVYGDIVSDLTLADRITISSMATEMGAIIILFPPTNNIIEYCKKAGNKDFNPVTADEDAKYAKVIEINIDNLEPLISKPGHPEDVVFVKEVLGKKIDSVFIGSCTNGRYEDLKAAAEILKGKKVAPGVVLKIVPSTDEIWNKCLDEGLIKIFKDAGALFGNAGCAGCAAGQIGQNGPGEITISTGNRNFTGKQGKGEVYLASPRTAAASAIAGFIALHNDIPEKPEIFTASKNIAEKLESKKTNVEEKPNIIKGKVWIVKKDNIDTDMIFHNRYLTITDIDKMGQYTFDNLAGFEDFSKKASKGDIIITGKNFGCGSSRQQAVDCFKSLGISLVIAESFGAIYERNAINAGFPIMTSDVINEEIKNGDEIEVNIETGFIENISTGKKYKGNKFSEVQLDIYKRGDLLTI